MMNLKGLKHPNGDVEKAPGYEWVWQTHCKDPHLLIFTAQYNPLSFNNLLLTNRIQQLERLPLLCLI